MYGGVPKAWTRRSRVKLSTALQETLLDAIANNAGVLDAPGHWEDLLTLQAQSSPRTTESSLQSEVILPKT